MRETSSKSKIILYKTDDGKVRLDVRLEHETLWLTQAAMAELFQTTPQNITLHLKAIYEKGELIEKATCKDYLQVQTEGARQVSRTRKSYSLPAIIAVGYRVNSNQGTQFRQWATQRLNEYVVKGFTMDDERLKEGVNIGSNYFDEVLERIRAVKNDFIKRYGISIGWRLTMIPKLKRHSNSFASFKINFTLLFQEKPLLKSFLNEQMLPSPIWVLQRGRGVKSALAILRLLKIILIPQNLKGLIVL